MFLFNQTFKKGKWGSTLSWISRNTAHNLNWCMWESYVLRLSDTCGNSNRNKWNHCVPKNDATLFMNALRPVKLWPSLMKSPTYFDSLTPNSPPLSTTAPFIPWSCSGFLCVRGRKDTAPLQESGKIPLPSTSHTFSKLVIRIAYDKHLHPGFNATITALHQTFWITSIGQPQIDQPQIMLPYTNREFKRNPLYSNRCKLNGETKSCNIFGSLLVQSEGYFIWMFLTSNREQFPIKPSAGSQAVNQCQYSRDFWQCSTYSVSAETLSKLLQSPSL